MMRQKLGDKMSPVPRSATAALLIVAVVCALGVGAATAIGSDTFGAEPAPEIVTATNSTDYLIPDRANVTQRGYVRADLDLGAVMAADAERIQGRHDQLVYDRIQSSERLNDDQAILTAIDSRAQGLESRQARLFERYSSGSISAETLLRGLARLEVAADTQREHIDRYLDDRSELESAYLTVYPSMLSNPVSEKAVAAQSGQGAPTSVYLIGAPDSLAAATVVGDTYYRQATLRGERDPAGTDKFEEGELGRARAAGNRAQDLYSDRSESVRGFGGTHVYEFNINHSHGELVGYLDGSTTNMIHEYQYKRPIVEVPAQTTSNTAESFRLNIQYTDPTGPMAVSLLGTGTDVPPEVTVSVDGEAVGTIGQTGQLWTIQPIGQFTVTAITEDGDTTSVTIPGS